MIILIPIGGRGRRFKEYGIDTPKALIEVLGKPIIFWLLDNLNYNDELIYIPYNKEYVEYSFETKLTTRYPHYNFRFHVLTENTLGAAHTVYLALNELNVKDDGVVCLDADNFYRTPIVPKFPENKLVVFEDNEDKPIFSYIQVNQGLVKTIVEKERISNLACTGAYMFKSFKQLREYCSHVIDHKILQKGEYYMSNVINEMIKDFVYFGYMIVPKTDYVSLGTPEQVIEFEKRSL